MSVEAERMASSIGRMSRKQIKDAIRRFRGGFKMDFTDNYLDSLPIDELQHILLAAELRQGRR